MKINSSNHLLVIVLIGITVLIACDFIFAGGYTKINNFEIITIDGCEYIVLHKSDSSFGYTACAITHKGNCKNTIHSK